MVGESELPAVRIVVANYNGEQLLPSCLPSLHAQTFPNCEIVVVDNHSVDASVRVAREQGVRCLELPTNAGLAPAYNAGAADATTDFLFFMNNDMRLDPECIGALVDCLSAHPQAFAADPLQRSWDGEQLIHARTVLRRGRVLDNILPSFHVSYTEPADVPVPVPWACAGCFMVRRSHFVALGGFDPTFFIDFEDVDLCWRAWRLGWETWYVPAAQLWHRVSASRQPGSFERQRSHRRYIMERSGDKNRLRFVLKVLDPPYIGLYWGVLLFRLAGHTVLRHRRSVRILTSAILRSLRELPEIWQERRRLQREARFSNRDLYRLWGVEQGLPETDSVRQSMPELVPPLPATVIADRKDRS